MTTPESESGGGAEPARERRRHPRVSVPWPAIVQNSDGHFVAAEVIDVSLSGMKLRVASQVLVGDAVKLRVTLPRGAGDIEISAQVVRRDPDGIGVDFGRLPPEQAARFKLFVPTWDLRRRAERVDVDLPVHIDGAETVTRGRTVDLSVVGGRVTTEERLTAGAMVAVRITPNDGHGPLSIRAVVWEADADSAVLVFANLPATDFVRLRAYVESLARHS